MPQVRKEVIEMKNLGKWIAVVYAIVAIKRLVESRRVCACVGPVCFCSTK